MAGEPYGDCPRFQRCSVNVCPLDPEMASKEVSHPLPLLGITGDPELRCTLPRGERVQIAEQHPGVLPWSGLRPREYAALAWWESLSAEQKEEVRDRGRVSLLKRRVANEAPLEQCVLEVPPMGRGETPRERSDPKILDHGKGEE